MKRILPSRIKNTVMLFSRSKITSTQLLKTRLYDFLTIAAITIYGIVFSYSTILKHNVFRSYAWDLGIFSQSLFSTLYEGRLFFYTAELFLNPSGSYFAIHFSPILFLLLPLYALNPSPVTLLVTKSFILALGALPLYLLAKELLKSGKAGFMLAIVYLMYAPLQGANWFDFQPLAFFPFLFFSACYFMIKRRWKVYFLSMLLTLTVEEHVAFPVFVLGAYYFLISGNIRSLFKSVKTLRMNENLAATITLPICVVYFLVAAYVRNYFPINPEFIERYKALGAFSILGVEENPMLFPIYVLSNLQRGFEALVYDYPLKFLYIILLFALFYSYPLGTNFPLELWRFCRYSFSLITAPIIQSAHTTRFM